MNIVEFQDFRNFSQDIFWTEFDNSGHSASLDSTGAVYCARVFFSQA